MVGDCDCLQSVFALFDHCLTCRVQIPTTSKKYEVLFVDNTSVTSRCSIDEGSILCLSSGSVSETGAVQSYLQAKPGTTGSADSGVRAIVQPIE